MYADKQTRTTVRANATKLDHKNKKNDNWEQKMMLDKRLDKG